MQLQRIVLAAASVCFILSCKARPNVSTVRKSAAVDLLAAAQALEVDTLKLASEENISLGGANQQLSLAGDTPATGPTDEIEKAQKKKNQADAIVEDLQQKKKDIQRQITQAIADGKAAEAALMTLLKNEAAKKSLETLVSAKQHLDKAISLLESLQGSSALDAPTIEGVLLSAKVLKQHRQVTEQAIFNLGNFYNWAPLPIEVSGSAPSARRGHAMISDGKELIVFAGLEPGNATPNANRGAIFDLAQKTWRPLPAFPSTAEFPPAFPIIHASAVAYGSSMIVWGGEQVGVPAGVKSYLDYGLSYDRINQKWSKVAPADVNSPSPRRSHVAAVVGDKMYIWGGWSGTAPIGNGAAYDFVSQKWTAMPSGGPTARWAATAVVINGKIYIWGGHSPVADGGSLSDGAVFDPAGVGTWTAIPRTDVVGHRGWHVATALNNKMVVWGGTSFGPNAVMYSDGGVFSPDGVGEKWHQIELPDAPQPRRAFASAIWSDGQALGMLIWGGADAANKDLRDGAILIGRPHP